jgi:sugar/nucleoside kinase (ribokinase family)
MRTPDVVIVGAATRDLNDEAPRGWLLGGGVTYGALALARLGVSTGVLLGVDDEARSAPEIDLIREAGAEIVEVPLARGPIFRNTETLAGRVQTCNGPSDPVPAAALPERWRAARAWVLAPVASEIHDEWAATPPRQACVALAWQGILRHLEPGVRVRPREPGPSALVRRADILAVSRHDIPDDLPLRSIGQWLPPSAELLLTAGLLGGLLVRFQERRVVGMRAYPSVPSTIEIDATGAGDTMLAGLVAARVVGGSEGSLLARDVHLGALASSLLVEGPGMNSVPWLGQVRERLAGARG